MTSLIRPFVIGSSWPVVIGLFLNNTRLKWKNYSYEQYTYLAPLYLGAVNALSVWLAGSKMDPGKRLLYTGLVSAAFVVTLSMCMKTYPYNTVGEWSAYALRIAVLHLILFRVFICTLDKYV